MKLISVNLWHDGLAVGACRADYLTQCTCTKKVIIVVLSVALRFWRLLTISHWFRYELILIDKLRTFIVLLYFYFGLIFEKKRSYKICGITSFVSAPVVTYLHKQINSWSIWKFCFMLRNWLSPWIGVSHWDYQWVSLACLNSLKTTLVHLPFSLHGYTDTWWVWVCNS